MKRNPKVSIIIRTKNEEEWLRHTLVSLKDQTFKEYEIIIVDNQSDDLTLKICHDFKIKKILNINKYIPGKSINIGVKKALGEIIVLLSAHCVPTNKNWLKNLIAPLADREIVACYGRQSPTSTSKNSDIRDLFITFGLDRKIQIKDPFFHNANSAIKKNILKEIPFDETLSNIEDRDWGKKVIKNNYKICYEPLANVYHYHGIHHNNSEERVMSTVNVLKKIENINLKNFIPKTKKFKNLNFIISIIFPNNLKVSNYKKSLENTINFFDNIFDNQKIIIFKNSKTILKNISHQIIEFKKNNLDLDEKLLFAYNIIKKIDFTPDYIIYVNPDYFIRDKKIFLNLVRHSLKYNFDSTILALNDFSSNIIYDKNKINTQGGSLVSREKKKPILKSLFGFGTIVKPKLFKNGELISNDNMGIITTDNLAYSLRLSDHESIQTLKKNNFL